MMSERELLLEGVPEPSPKTELGTILVVEDDPRMQKVLKRIFAEEIVAGSTRGTLDPYKRRSNMGYPNDRRYTKDHEWIAVSGGTATVGITEYAQHELGDVVFVELPKPGAKIETGKSFGTVESVKAVSEIYAPASGEVIEANADLQNTPEKINSDPHNAAWLIKIKLADPADVNGLMDAPAYEAYIAEKAKEAAH